LQFPATQRVYMVLAKLRTFVYVMSAGKEHHATRVSGPAFYETVLFTAKVDVRKRDFSSVSQKYHESL